MAYATEIGEEPLHHAFLLTLGGRLLFSGAAMAIAAAAIAVLLVVPSNTSQSDASLKTAPQAVPVSVAVVEQRNVSIWDEFSGRIEAVERVDVRSRVAGAVQAAHFREGSLVAEGDLLITIDPAPFAAEVERLNAQVGAAEARLSLTKKELERSRRVATFGIERDFSRAPSIQREARTAKLKLLCKLRRLQCNWRELNLGYSQVRAPVSGRVGRLEITVGNLIAAGPSAPVLD